MHDLKWNQVNSFDTTFQSVASEIQAAEITNVAVAFTDNMNRVIDMGSVPVRTMFHAVVPHLVVLQDAQRKVKTDVIEALQKSLAISDRLLDSLQRNPSHLDDVEELASSVVYHLGANDTPDVAAWNGLQSILASQLIATWTAFETLAGDLWETALNINPRWSVLGDENKQVSLPEINRLTKGQFNLSHMMGTFHRRSKRGPKFTGIDAIRDAYLAAFGADLRNVHEPLNDTSLNALSAVRNLLVHAAGVADDDYVVAIKGAETAPRLELHERLYLDGEVSSGLISPVVRNCVKLLKAVDVRITAR